MTNLFKKILGASLILVGIACLIIFLVARLNDKVEDVELSKDVDLNNLVVNDNLSFDVKPYDENEYSTYNTEVDYSKEEGLKSYTVNNNKISFTSIFNNYIEDRIIYNSSEIGQKNYYGGDMLVDSYFLGDVIIDNIYENDKLAKIYIGDSIFTANYDTKNRLTEFKMDQDLLNEYKYLINGRVSEEKTVACENAYQYNDGLLSSNYDVNYQVNGNEIVVNNVKYIFGYEYQNNKYVTKIVAPTYTLEFSYLNDKITSVVSEDYSINYILDNELNYFGFEYSNQIYYYVYDFSGNVLSVIDSVGNSYASYSYSAYGNVYISDDSSEVSEFNNIIFPQYIYDNNLLIGKNEVILEGKKVISLIGECKNLSSDYNVLNNDSIFKRDEILAVQAIETKVKFDVMKLLESNDIYCASDVQGFDKNNIVSYIYDIYILDYGLCDVSSKNFYYENTVYDIFYRGQDETALQEEVDLYERQVLDKVRAGYYVDDYSNSSAVKKATPKFSVQFKYLGFLVHYESLGDGKIYFRIQENKKDNYIAYVNIFDYDNNEYLNYANKTFEVQTDFTNSIEIIPGLNQEHYIALNNYLSELEQISGEIYQEQLEYFDENYYNVLNASLNGDTLSYYKEIDSSHRIEISSSGDVVIEAIPFYMCKDTIKNVAISAGVIAVAAAVSVVLIYTGVGTAVVPYVVAFTKGALVGATSHVAANVVCGAIDVINMKRTDPNYEITLKSFVNETVNRSCKNLAQATINGGIAGVIMQGINSITTNIQRVSNDAKIETLRRKYDYDYLRDDSAAMQEFSDKLLKLEKKRISIEFRANSNSHLVKKYLTKTTRKVSFHYVKQKLGWG